MTYQMQSRLLRVKPRSFPKVDAPNRMLYTHLVSITTKSFSCALRHKSAPKDRCVASAIQTGLRPSRSGSKPSHPCRHQAVPAPARIDLLDAVELNTTTRRTRNARSCDCRHVATVRGRTGTSVIFSSVPIAAMPGSRTSFAAPRASSWASPLRSVAPRGTKQGGVPS